MRIGCKCQHSVPSVSVCGSICTELSLPLGCLHVGLLAHFWISGAQPNVWHMAVGSNSNEVFTDLMNCEGKNLTPLLGSGLASPAWF